MKLSCAFTGHRPESFNFQYDENSKDCIRLKEALRIQITALAMGNVDTFLCGMAQGVDTWAAEIILDLKIKYPHLRLICVLPFNTHTDLWTPQARERHTQILQHCDEAITISPFYERGSIQRRNRWLVDNSDILLAVYNGSNKGGTAQTIYYALAQEKPILLLDTHTLEISSL